MLAGLPWDWDEEDKNGPAPGVLLPPAGSSQSLGRFARTANLVLLTPLSMEINEDNLDTVLSAISQLRDMGATKVELGSLKVDFQEAQVKSSIDWSNFGQPEGLSPEEAKARQEELEQYYSSVGGL